MPNWMPSLYPGGRARLIPRRTSFNASRRSEGSAARYSVTVDAGMGQAYHESFFRGNCNVRRHSTGQRFFHRKTSVVSSDLAPRPFVGPSFDDGSSRFSLSSLADVGSSMLYVNHV